jgi:hypothetical protein
MFDLAISAITGEQHQDIEQLADRSYDSIWPNSCISFDDARDGKDGLVVVAELHRTSVRHHNEHEHVRITIGRAIFDAFQLSVGEAVLLLPHAIPHTSSGKFTRTKRL